MTNTKFRKRALLSSVAMLLVALVALGSATFAWFTSDPTAKASGLHMKANASTGLVIMTQSAIDNANADKTKDSDWLHEDYLNCNTGRTGTKPAGTNGVDLLNLIAASTNQSTTDLKFYTTTAKLDDNSAADPDKAVTEATPYHDTIWMKVTGTTAAQPVKITGLTVTAKSGATTKASALVPAVRVVLAMNDKYIGEYAQSAGSSDHIYATAATYSALTSTTKKSANFAAYSSAANQALGNVKTDGTDKLDVYVFLDGENAAVKNTNVDLTEVIQSVQVNLAIAS